jgi:L-lactate dehydrogenase complex protein LldG
MNAREDILAAIRMRRTGVQPRPPRYRVPTDADDLLRRFAERAIAESAEVRVIDSMADVPAAVADLLRARNLAASVHIPLNSQMDALPWSVAVERVPPGPNDAAIAVVPFAIAETGTLVYPSTSDQPASWHFRPGLEIAVVPARNILPQLEDVLARLRKNTIAPHTINLVTGPSRTGDIEQTLELGAHGPKALSILIVRG